MRNHFGVSVLVKERVNLFALTEKLFDIVTPTQSGAQKNSKRLDSRFSGNDINGKKSFSSILSTCLINEKGKWIRKCSGWRIINQVGRRPLSK